MQDTLLGSCRLRITWVACQFNTALPRCWNMPNATSALANWDFTTNIFQTLLMSVPLCHSFFQHFEGTNLCRIPLSFSIFKKYCHRLITLIAYPRPTDEEQSHPSAMAETYSWAQKHLQASCLWSTLHFTRTQGLVGKVSLSPWEDVETSLVFSSFSLCFLGTPSSVGSVLVRLKACSSPPTSVEPLATTIQEATWELLHKWV